MGSVVVIIDRGPTIFASSSFIEKNRLVGQPTSLDEPRVCRGALSLVDPWRPISALINFGSMSALRLRRYLVRTQPLVVIEKALEDRNSNHCTDIAACWFSAWMNR
jgi:hypothetical protein